MKPYVLMNKKTGDLLIGYKVWSESALPNHVIQTDGLVSYWLSMPPDAESHDGWVVEMHPDVSPYAIWFNRKFDKFVEVLGEL